MMSNPPAISTYVVTAGSGSIQGGDALEELVNAGLTLADGRGLLQPQLAEAVPTIENGLWKIFSDGRMETTWRIKPNVVWHDGTAFTVDDLVFTARLGQDKDIPIFRHNGFDLIERVEPVDARTVRVTWTQPYIQADTMFTRRFASPRPRHVLEPAYLENRESVTVSPYWTHGYVGTGPFMLREWVGGSHLVLQANERYWAGRPQLDEIEIRFIPDANTLVANVLAGRIELTLGRNVAPGEAMQLRERWTNGRVEFGLRNWVILWPQLINPGTPLLLDVQFRRAVLQAIDRQQLVDTLEYGLVPVAHAFLSPTDPNYPAIESQIVKYAYDPRRATQLIEGLGYARAADGLFRDPAGQALALEVRTNPGHEERVLAVADDLKRFGLASEPFIIPDARRSDREYDATFPGLRLERQPNDTWDLYRYDSKSARLPETNFVGGNRSRYMNPAFDALIDRYMTTISAQEQLPILGQIVHHMTDQVTVMGVHYNAEPMMIGNRLQHVAANAASEATEAWNAHEWNVVR